MKRKLRFTGGCLGNTIAAPCGFLLGAGVSCDCGGPTTLSLTHAILNAPDTYFRHTDETYRRRFPGIEPLISPNLPSINAVVGFLRLLQGETEHYYANRQNVVGCDHRMASYEDLAYLSVQIEECLTYERDNPAVVPFAENVARGIGVSLAQIGSIAREASLLIRSVVTEELSSLQVGPGFLQCVTTALREQHNTPIVTLNHDLLIEATCSAAGISLSLPIRSRPDGRKILDIKEKRGQASLYKLHGSINWYVWRPTTSTRRKFPEEWIGYFRSDGEEAAQRRNWSRHDELPQLLIGRFNKELSYLTYPFLELQVAARRALNRVSTLVVSGYSFGDKAVNTMLIDWLLRSPCGRRKIFVAHQHPDSVWAQSRGAIKNKWTDWKKSGILVEIPRFLGQLQWEELQDVLRASGA